MLKKRWLCPVTTLRWSARFIMMSQERSGLGKLSTLKRSCGVYTDPLFSFTLREGGKTIGTGIITEILETA